MVSEVFNILDTIKVKCMINEEYLKYIDALKKSNIQYDESKLNLNSLEENILNNPELLHCDNLPNYIQDKIQEGISVTVSQGWNGYIMLGCFIVIAISAVITYYYFNSTPTGNDNTIKWVLCGNKPVGGFVTNPRGDISDVIILESEEHILPPLTE